MSSVAAASAFPHRFTGLHDLARLPWFAEKDGRLVVVDPSVDRAIDMHTHLALAFVRPMAVDLTASHARVEHYLPDALKDARYYHPKDVGAEAAIKARLDGLMAHQLAAHATKTEGKQP